MPKGVCLILTLIPLGLCCNSQPKPDSGLYIDFNLTADGDGSECFPLQSIAKGFEMAGEVSISRLILAQTDGEGSITRFITIDTNVTVEGRGSTIVLFGAISVKETGVLRLEAVKLKQRGGEGGTLLEGAGGWVEMHGVEIVGGNRTVVELFGGILDVRSGSVWGQATTLILIHNETVRVSITDTEFRNDSRIIEISAEGGGDGSVNLDNLTIANVGIVVSLRENGGFGMNIQLRNSLVQVCTATVFAGAVANINMLIYNSTIFQSRQVFAGSVANSTISIDNCTFHDIETRLFDLSSLDGQLSLSNSTISGVAQGPVILVSANVYPAASAIVIITDTLIANVTNLKSKGLCIVFVGVSASFQLLNTEIRNSVVLEGGIFSITGGSVLLSNVFYHDCVSVSFSFYEAKASAVLLRNVVMRSTSSDVIAFSSCIIGTECRWVNVSITNSTDPNVPRARSFVLLWAGYFGFATVTESYFHNIGFSEPCMAATEHGRLHVYNSTFVDLNHNNAFAANSEGFVLHRNVTYVRPHVNMLFWCTFAANCYNLSQLTIVGESHVPLILFTVGGRSVVEDSVFTGVSDSIFRVSSANLTVRNVTATKLLGFVCRVCLTSLITFESFSLTDTVTPLLLQFTYSTIFLSNFRVRNVTCEQLLSLDISQAEITGGEFQDVRMNSFGGLIMMSDSSLLIRNSSFEDLHSTLSIRVGLIYVETSDIRIENSRFLRFNETLIYSIQSPVQIFDSEFTDGGLYDTTGSKAVLTYGGVLRCESPGTVKLVNSLFVHVSADNGGVVYITGQGRDTCDIENCTAGLNHARRNGGFLYAYQVIITIRNSELVHNSAVQGGALWTAGLYWELLTRIFSTKLHSNSAIRDGGGLLYLRSKYSLTDSVWENNTAEYGANFASEIATLSVLDRISFTPIANYTIRAVSGQVYSDPIVIGCLDELRQITATDNSSKLTLYTSQSNVTITVSTLLEAKRGIFTIPSMMIVGSPGSNFPVFGTLTAFFTTQLFSVQLRECITGEYFDNNQCKPCTHNTYSFSPEQHCKLCPENADCPAGYLLSLHRGYWRPFNMTDDIYECLVPEPCVGGIESECELGHSGTMCGECDSNYYKVSQIQCVSCGISQLSISKGIVTLFLSVASVGYSLSLSVNGAMVHLITVDYLQSIRILINFNIYWPKPLAYLYSVAGDLGSLGLTAFTDSCVHPISSLKKPYSELLFSLIYFCILTFGFPLLFFVASLLCINMNLRKIVAFTFYIGYLLLPTLLMRGIQLLRCFRVTDQQFLIYDSSIECWSDEHLRYSIAMCLPLFLISLSAPLLLFAIAIVSSYRDHSRIPSWKATYLALLLLRKYILLCLLVFSNALALCTQVGLVIATNITTEIAMYRLRDCPRGFFFGLHQSTLVATTLQAFVCAIYFAATDTYEKEFPFIIVNYLCAAVPAAYVVMSCIYLQKKEEINLAQPTSVVGELREDQGIISDEHALELSGSENMSESYQKVPNVSMVLSKAEAQDGNISLMRVEEDYK